MRSGSLFRAVPLAIFWLLAGLFDRAGAQNYASDSKISDIAFEGFQSKYGIRDLTHTTWLTSPNYDRITELVADGPTGRMYYGYIAEKGNKKTLIAANGSSTLSPEYEDIRRITQIPDIFVVAKGKDYFLFQPAKGLLTPPGAFTWYNLIHPRILNIKTGNRFHLFDLQKTGGLSPAFEEISRTLNGYSQHLVVARSGNNWGIWDVEAVREKLPFVYENIVGSNGHILLKKQGKWGLADGSGQPKLDSAYDSIVPLLRDGFLLVKRNGKWGLLDTNYRQRLAFDYEQIHFSTDPRTGQTTDYFVARQGGKWGLLSTSGKWLVANSYDSVVAPCRDGFYVMKDGKMGLVDSKGKIRFPFLYKHIEREDQHRLKESRNKLYFVSNDWLAGERHVATWGLADSNGKLLQPIAFNKFPLLRRHRYKTVDEEDTWWNYDDHKLVGYIWNSGGKMEYAVSFMADTVNQETFNEMGEATITKVAGGVKYSAVIKGGRTGILDRDGQLSVPALYEDFIFQLEDTEYDDRNHSVSLSGSGFFGLGTSGYDYTRTEVPLIAKRNARWGVCDWKGKELVPCRYDTVEYCPANDLTTDPLMPVFRAWLGKHYGYYSLSGKELIPPSIEWEPFSIAVRDTAPPREYGYDDKYNYFRLAFKDAEPDTLYSYIISPNYDVNGREYMARTPRTFVHFAKAKFRIIDARTQQFTSSEWADDLLLINGSSARLYLSKVNTQGRLDRIKDSLFDPSGKLISVPEEPGDHENWHYSRYVFLKSGGKWYLHDLYQRTLINKELPFDSIQPVDERCYKAWRNRQQAYYNYGHKGAFDRWRDVDFPDEGRVDRIACKDCNYRNIHFSVSQVTAVRDGNTGFYKEKSVTRSIDVPLIQSGSVNLIDTANAPLLKIWAEDLRLPPTDGIDFNLRDTSSAVFNKNTLNGYPYLLNRPASIALKYKGVWRLTRIEHQEKFIDGFTAIHYEGDCWVARTGNKEVYYRISDLVKIKEVVLK